MQDMHLYVFSRWVLELLEMNPRLESLRLHLIPYLVKKQFSNYAVEGNVRKLPESAFANQGTALADWSHLQAFRESAREIVKCYAHVSREGICYRINNTEAYLEALRDVRSEIWASLELFYNWFSFSRYIRCSFSKFLLNCHPCRSPRLSIPTHRGKMLRPRKWRSINMLTKVWIFINDQRFVSYPFCVWSVMHPPHSEAFCIGDCYLWAKSNFPIVCEWATM